MKFLHMQVTNKDANGGKGLCWSETPKIGSSDTT